MFSYPSLKCGRKAIKFRLVILETSTDFMNGCSMRYISKAYLLENSMSQKCIQMRSRCENLTACRITRTHGAYHRAACSSIWSLVIRIRQRIENGVTQPFWVPRIYYRPRRRKGSVVDQGEARRNRVRATTGSSLNFAPRAPRIHRRAFFVLASAATPARITV